MFKSNIVTPYNIGDVKLRKDIGFGNVFDYVDGTGTRYGAISTYRNFAFAFKLKPDFGQPNHPLVAVSSACSPMTSRVLDNNCCDRGFSSIELLFDVIPSINTHTAMDAPLYASIISLPNVYDSSKNPHLFMNLGASPLSPANAERAPEICLLKLTTDDTNSSIVIISVPLTTLMAVRGTASLVISEQKEK